ncbi:MAG: hypothetical protein ACI4N1_12805 [Stenotrophomonas koreensis]
MSRAEFPRRWAKVLVVDGVMASIQHVWDGDNEQYAIVCKIQCDGMEFKAALEGDEPFPQAVFDQVGDDLVRACIKSARDFGLQPLAVVGAG